MAEKKNLTERLLKTLVPPESGRLIVRDAVQVGLYIQVMPSGRMTWYLKRRVGSRVENQSIGVWPEVTVDAARRIAVRMVAAIAEGAPRMHSPKRRTASEKTLGEMWAWWRAVHGLAKRTAERDARLWDRDISAWKSIPFSQITRQQIRERMGELTTARGPGAARKMLELLRAIYRTAIDELELAVIDPTRGISVPRPAERERFLRTDELPRFFESLAQLRSQVAKDFLLLLLFTGARRSNVAAMEWSELELSYKTWIIPAEKYKMKRETVVILPDIAVEILKRRMSESDSEWVFPGRGGRGHYAWPKDAWTRVVTRAGLVDVRMHDLRRTLGSFMAMGNASLSIIGKALGHTSPRSTKIYARLQTDSVRPAVQVAASAISRAAKKRRKKS